MNRLIVFGICIAGGLTGSVAAAGVDVETGRTIYQARCAACHSIEFNGVGPAHKGVYGRRIGQAPGYAYSPALKAATGRWTAENLDKWLSDPEKLPAGQKMGINLENAADRANVIEYLKSVSARE
jgi:cytochrome c